MFGKQLKHAAEDLAQQPGQVLQAWLGRPDKLLQAWRCVKVALLFVAHWRGHQACTAPGELGSPAARLAPPGLSFG